MGKKDFESKILSRLGNNFTCKISYYSDVYESSGRFAGIIIYHYSNDLNWTTSKGHKARGCYILIQNTAKWPAGAIHDRAGQGMVHDYLYKYITNNEYSQLPNAVCCGGFAVDKGLTKYSSIWLNKTNNTSCAFPWESDNDKNLSAKEKQIVDQAIQEWKQKGKNIVVPIKIA